MIEDMEYLSPKEKVLEQFPNASCTIKRYRHYPLWCIFLELNSEVFIYSFVSEEYAWQHAEIMIDIKSNLK